MAYTVNWITKEIQVPTTDLVLVSGKHYKLLMSSFLIEVRRLEASFIEGLWADQILDHTNQKTLAGIPYAPMDEIINDYTITFTGDVERVDLYGTNNNIIDVLNYSGVSVVPSNSGGLVVGDGGSAIELGYVEQRIYVDTERLTNGNGTQTNPFNNIISAKDYLEGSGLTIIVLSGDVVIPNNLKNITIMGVGLPTIDTNGMDLKGSKFYQVQIQGDYINNIIVQESMLLNGFTLQGTFEKCAIHSELFPKGSLVTLKECFNGSATLPTTLNLGLSIAGTNLIVDSFGGDLDIVSSTNALNKIKIGMKDSTATFDASCTNGDMEVTGVCRHIDNTVGKVVVDNTLFRQNIAEAIAGYTRP